METTAQEEQKGERFYIIRLATGYHLFRVKRKDIASFLALLGDCLIGAGDTREEAVCDAKTRDYVKRNG